MKARLPNFHFFRQRSLADLSSVPRLGRRLGFLFLIVLLGAGLRFARAQDSDNGNPTGPTGDFNGEVTTGGSYDPYTLNAKRSITDVVVPGSNGTYPLAFTRTYNSGYFAVSGDASYFGDGGNWRHSYMWTLATTDYDSQNNIIAYTVAYPSGAVVTFRSYPGFGNQPGDIYWRGASGTQDRLEVASGNVCLHTSDGGFVYFDANCHASIIVDPYGAKTILSYDTAHPGLLHRVTEPGGRWLQFTYASPTYDTRNTNHDPVHYVWTVLSSIQTSTGQWVFYNYITTDPNQSHEPPNGGDGQVYMTPYCVLDNVDYDYEPSVSGSSKVAAHYAYTQSISVGEGTIPLIATARDPHFGGAMVNIQYQYSDLYSGYIQEEQNYTTSECVSHVDYDPGTNTSTETRGDQASGGVPITRKFVYGASSNAMGPQQGNVTNAHDGRLTSSTDFEGHSTYLSYYPAGSGCGGGNLFAVTDALGNSTLYSHEPYAGKVNFIQLPDGRVRSWYWLSKDLSTGLQPYYLLQYTDERGQSTTYFRDPNTGLVTEIDYPDGGHEYFSYTGFTYNGNNFYKIYCHTDKRGAQSIYNYDETDVNHGGSGYMGLLTSVTRSYADSTNTVRSERTVFYYDTLDRLTQSVDPRGVATQFAYNARHQLIQTLHVADGTHTDRYYDDVGNCYSATDEMGHASSTYYDEYRRPTVVVQDVLDGINDHHVDYFSYAPCDANHNAYATATSHTRSTWGVHSQQSGRFSWRVFSPNNWLTDSYAGNERIVHTDYNAVGLAQDSVDGLGFATTYTYDICNRLTDTQDPNGHHATTSFYGPDETASGGGGANCAGLVKSVTVPGSDAMYTPTATTQSTGYDKMGRLCQTVAPPNSSSIPNVTLDSAYNTAGDLTIQDDGAQGSGGHQTGYGYDQLGRKVSCTYPDNTVERWTYDASGNVSTHVNRNPNQIKIYVYDGRNRCTGTYWQNNDAAPISYEYDPASRVTRVYNGYADNHFTYSNAGELLTESAQLPNQPLLTTSYTHDIDGRVISILYPHGDNPTYSYDAQGRCTDVSFSGVTFAHYNFDGRGMLSSRCLSAIGLDTKYAYQNNGRLSSLQHCRGDASGGMAANGSIRNQFYGYAPDGQMSWTFRANGGDQTGRNSALDDGRGDAYYYYPDGSLQAACRNYGVTTSWPGAASVSADARVDASTLYYQGGAVPSAYEGYVYDPAGNRASVAVPPYQGSYVADGQNRYSSLSSNAGSSGAMLYNANGNTTNALLGWTYNYDAENHLMSAYGPNGQAMYFAYDGLGRMSAEYVNGLGKVYYYAGSQRIEERNSGTQAPMNQYFFDGPGGDSIFLRVDQQLGFLWYLYDAQGNTTHLCDSSCNVLEMYGYDAYGTPTVYDPYGNVRSGGTAWDNRYLFKGAAAYEWYPAAGLYYCRTRFYQPYHGRWLQPDPIGQAGGLNIYTYCHNDPINRIDASGCYPGEGVVDAIGNALKQAYDWAFSPSSTSDASIPYRGVLEGASPGDRVVITASDPKPTASPISFLSPGALAGYDYIGSGPDQALIANARFASTIATFTNNYATYIAVASVLAGVDSERDDDELLEEIDEAIEGKPKYEIMSGVRRAYSAYLLGNPTINATILGSGNQVSDVPVSQLLAPYEKATIDISTDVNSDRFFRVFNLMRDGNVLDPIEIQPGNDGIPIEDVTLDAIGGD